MNLLKLNVFDVSGRRSCQVEAPDDIPIDRIILLLVEKMDLPINSPDGQIMSYKMHHRKTAAQLIDDQTLSEAGVDNGDELRLQPEITAGHFRYLSNPNV